jgi:hypothetical protein
VAHPENAMTRRILAPFLAALLLTTAAHAAKEDMVKEITVEIDLEAITNPAAALRFANISQDLKNAIATRLTNRSAEEGMAIFVDISEVELSNSFTEVVGSAETRLVGDVRVSDDNGNPMYVYELTVDVNAAKTYFPADTDMTALQASSDSYYTALIFAFADAVVKRFDE